MKEQLDRIEAKLDKVIKAMQEYDGLDEDFNEPEDEYRKYKTSPCIGHDAASWDEEVKERAVKASKKFGEKKAEDTREYLKTSNINDLPDFQHTPPPPKPKRKYYKPKKKKNETL
jgi:hypothetical protein